MSNKKICFWHLYPFSLRIRINADLEKHGKARKQSPVSRNALVKIPYFFLKGALSGLRQFLAIESSFKIMKNAFYFNSKALFVLKIFRILS